MITIYQRHRRTDRQTDDMRSQDRALHKVHRAVITIWAQKHFAYAHNIRYVTYILEYVTLLDVTHANLNAANLC